MHFRGAVPASFTGEFDLARSARDGATPRRWRFAQVRSDDALYRPSRFRAAGRGRRAACFEEPRRPRLRQGPRLRRRHGRGLEAGPPREHADEQLLVRVRCEQGAAAAQGRAPRRPHGGGDAARRDGAYAEL